jgi:7-cyano-7-deazaguanine synthase
MKRKSVLYTKKRAICLISGGLDSTVSTSIVINKGYTPIFLFFRYGQKTLKKEEECLDKLVKHYQIKDIVKINLPWIKEFGGSALLEKNIPLNEINFRKEYVPFRNSIFLSIATALAEVKNAKLIVIGSTGGDHICTDNSPEYLASFQKIIKQGTMLKKNIKIFSPLLKTDKEGAIKIGKKLKVPFQYTWSCHNNINKACGHCSNCKARLEAFKLNKIKDPIIYQKK